MDQTADKPEINGPELRQRGERYMERIRASEKRENDWINEAKSAERAYAADTSQTATDGKVYDFNILHSNVETIVPAIYNSTPVPDIRPRRVEATGPKPQPPQMPQGQQMDLQAAAQMQQQMAQFQEAAEAYQAKVQADKDAKDYGTMLERSIAVQIDDNRLDTEIESEAQDSFMAGRGVVRLRFEGEYGVSEKVTPEAVSWRDYREGPAKRWDSVPWVAYRVPMAREVFDQFSNKELLDAQQREGDVKPTDETDADDIEVWELWDKLKGVVVFIRADDGKIIKEEPDPLGLPGFFPQGAPVQPITLTGKRTPVCPFTIYKALAEELDRITKRINRIMSGMKVRGLVAGDASSLAKLSDADDNEILVEPNLEQLVQTGGLDKAIAWWPIEQAAKVLAQLYQQRDQIKAAIYEITGISDIVRGASNAGETATAQKIKTQWGSLRIQKMQRLIERQVRDIFALMAHLISTKFSPETLTRMTGIEITPGMLELMKSPVDAAYRINVESDSTVKADLTRQKGDMQEFLAGSAQFFATAATIIQQQPAAAEPLAEVYAATTRFYKLGKQAEDALERFVVMAKEAAANPPPNPEAEAKKAEMAMKEKEMSARMAETQAKVQGDQRRAGIDVQKAEIEFQIKQLELQMKNLDLAIKQQEAAAPPVENEGATFN